MRIVLALLVLVGMAAGCGDESLADKGCDDDRDAACAGEGELAPPPGRPDIRGPLSAAEQGSVRIDEGTGAFDAAAIRITQDTGVQRRDGGSYTTADAGDLTVGTEVQVWFSGPVAESYPVQGTADVVLIDD